MPNDYIVYAAAALVGLLIVAAAALKGWQGWLAFKTRELEQHDLHHRPALESGTGNGQMTSRIEIADLKERIRKLEAIAAGVDL